MSFHHNESRVYELSAQGSLEAALEFVRSLSLQAREESRFFDYAEANLLLMSGAADAALGILEAVGDSGGWIRPSLLRQDADFAPLAKNGRFREVCDLFQGRYDEASRSAVATKSVLSPSSDIFGRHVLVVLHGDNGCAAHSLTAWGAAVELGWTVLALQSGELGDFDGKYRWGAPGPARGTITDALAELLIPGKREVVLAGFSRGGEVALRLAVEGVGECRRALSICPAPMREPLLGSELTVSTLEEAYVFAGQDDPQYGCALSAAEELSSFGVAVTLDKRAAHGHEFPQDFASILSIYLRDSAA